METWRFGEEAVKRDLSELTRKVWKEERIPQKWRKSIIVSLYKRNEMNNVDNYIYSAYKIYAEILRNRLEREVEEKKLLPESQAGFRKGHSTMDNIYVLNHIVQRKKGKEKGSGVRVIY